jgi:hypothetical protein
MEPTPIEQLTDQLNKTCEILDDYLQFRMGADAQWENYVGVDEVPQEFADCLPIGDPSTTQALWRHRESCNSLLAWLSKDQTEGVETLESILRGSGTIDFSVRILATDAESPIVAYIRPTNIDGKTIDLLIRGDEVIVVPAPTCADRMEPIAP